MSEEIGRGVMRVEGDASHFEAAMAKATESASKFERQSVTSAGKAASALAGVGKSAAAGLSDMTAAERRFAAQAERTIVAMSGSRAEILRHKAAVSGLSEAFSGPLVEKVRAAEHAMQGFGKSTADALRGMDAANIKTALSTKQLSAAYRLLPAQITDIVTGLVSGQPAYLVAIQQGGQLKDSFGGIANAGRALMSIITPMRLAMAGLAGIIGGIAVAAYQSSQEAARLARTIAITGNAAGLTADRFREYSRAIAESTKTGIGAARDTLLSLAATGRLSGEALLSTAEAVQRLSTATGAGTDEIAKTLTALLDSGARGVANLNRQYNFLTVEQFKSIKSLHEMGRTQEGVALTMKLLNDRLGDQTRYLGVWARVLAAAKPELSGFWDALKGLFADSTIGDKLSAVSRNIADLEARLAAAAVIGNDEVTRSLERQLVRLRERRALLSSDLLLQQKIADAQADTALSTQQAIEGLLDKTGKSGKSGRNIYADLIKDITRMAELNEARIAAGGELTKTQELEIQLNDKLNDSLAELTKTQQENVRVVIKRALASQTALQAQADELKAAQGVAALRSAARQAEEAGIDSFIASLRAQSLASEALVRSAEDHVRALEQEEEAIDLVARTHLTLAAAIIKVQIARLEEERTKFIADSDEAARLTRLIELRERELNIINARAGRAADEANRLANVKAAEEAQKAWQKAADEINRSLTDAIFRAAESGENAFVALRRTIVGLFANLVLRPVIQAGVTGFAQSAGLAAAGSAVGSAVSQGFATGGLLGAFKGGTSGLASSFATSSIGTSLGLSNAIPAALVEEAAALGITGSTVSLSTAGSALAAAAPYLAAVVALYSVFKHKATPHIGAVAAADRIGASIVDSSVLNFPTPGTSPEVQNVVLSLSTDIQRSLQGLADAFEGGTIRVTTGFADDASKDGAWGSFRLAIGEFTAIDWSALADNDKWPGRGFADGSAGFVEFTTAIGQDIIRAISESISDSTVFGREIDRALEQLPDNAGLEQITAVIDYFVGLKPAFDQLSRVFGFLGLHLDTITEAAIDASGGLGKLATTVANYYDLTRTDAEKLADATTTTTAAFAALGVELPASMQAYRDLVDGLGAVAEDSAAQELVFDLMELAPAMRALSDALDEAARSAERTELELRRTTVQGKLDEIERVFGDLSVVAESVDTVSDAFVKARDGLKDLEDGLAELLGTAARTIQQTLGDMIASQRALQSVRATLADAIEEAALRGLSPEARVTALRSREAGLFASLGTATDPVAVANRLQAVVIARIKEEAGIRQAFEQSAIDALREQEELARDARDAQIDALREQIRGAERLKRLSEDIAQFTGSLRFSDISPLNPTAQLAAARALFDTTFAGASAGDEDAQRNLTQNARAYLDEARSYFASSAAYAGIFAQVTTALDALGLDAVNADPQIAALEAQIAALEALNDRQSELVDAVIETSAEEVAGLSAIDTALATREAENARRIDDQLVLAREQIAELREVRDNLASQLLAEQLNHAALMEEIREINAALDELNNRAAVAEGRPT